MSAEHGSHYEETTFAGTLISILFGILLIPQLLEKGEEVVQSLTAPQAAGHGGHH